MNKKSYLASALFAGCLLLGGVAAQAQNRIIKLTTEKSVGESITLLVNYTYKGVTVDWGDGAVVTYNQGNDKTIREITGEVKGSTITITGDGNWNMLSCSGCGLTDIDLSAARDFASLYCSDNKLTTIDLKEMTKLTDLDCSNNQITRFTFTKAGQPAGDLTSLEMLNISNNKFAGAFNYPISSLKSINISGNGFTSVAMSANPELRSFKCSDNSLRSQLVLTSCPKLSTLVCSNNSISSIFLAANITSLEQLVIDGNNITSTFNLTGCTNLSDLSIADNQISRIYLPANKLSSLNLSGNSLTFQSLPPAAYRPNYMAFMPQERLDISGFSNVLKDASGPYMPLSPSWSEASSGKGLDLDLSAYVKLNVNADGTGGVANQGVVEWYAVNSDGSETELQKGSSSDSKDYKMMSNRFFFFTPYDKVYARIVPSPIGVYKNTDYKVETTYIRLGESSTGIGSVGEDASVDLVVSTSRGQLTLSAATATSVRVVSVDGKTVWNGVVSAPTTISLPSGIYIVNGKKVAL